MIAILVHCKASLDSQSFEKIFTSAIYSLLDDRKDKFAEKGEYESFTKRYKGILTQLEEIASSRPVSSSKGLSNNCRKFLNECLEKQHEEFVEELRAYFMPMFYET